MKMTKANIKKVADYVSDNSTWGWTRNAADYANVTTQTVRNFLDGIGYSNTKLLTWFVREYEELKETDRLINDK